jgi:hypothetical protein
MKIKFVPLEDPDGKKRLQTAYNRIFTIARQNIIERRNLEKQKRGGVQL